VMRRLKIIFFAIVFCATAFFPASTQAHANIVESTPAANQVIAEAPATARLRFSEPLEASYSRVVLLSVEGGPVGTAPSRVDPNDQYALLLDLPPLPEGQYVLQWRTLSSADGHTLESVIPFAIGDPAAANAPLLLPPAPPDPLAFPPLLDVVLRWLTVLSFSLILGSLIFGLSVWQPIVMPDSVVSQQFATALRRLLLGAAGVALLAVVGAVLLAGSTTGLGPLGLLTGSRVGLLLGLRALLALALLASFALNVPYQHMVALGLSCAALLTISLLSHSAAPQTQDASTYSAVETGVAIAFDFVHLLATAAWLGALPALLLALRVLRRNEAEKQVKPTLMVSRFTSLASAAVIVLAATGSYVALQRLSRISELWSTTYGLALTIKLGLFLLLLALGGYNRWRIAPLLSAAARHTPATLDRLRQSVRFEIAAGLALLLAVGVLTASTPARDALGRAPGYLGSAEVQDTSLTLQVVRGDIAGDIFALDLRGLPAGTQPETLLRVSMPAHEMGEQDLKLREVEPGRWGGRATLLTMQGTWNVEAIVRASGMNDIRHTFLVDTAVLSGAQTAASAPPVWAMLLVLALVAAALSQLPLRQRMRARFQMSSIILIASAFVATTVPYYFARATATENPLTASSEVLASGKTIYQQNCVSCHGDGGRGDGPAARSLPGLPADFTQAHFMTHTDAELFGWIKGGKPGTAMPAFGEQLDDEQVWQVITYIRQFYTQANQ
jgi:copper transport protein